MENQNTLLWVVSIVAVVGIVAMVVATTRGGSVAYSAAPQLQYAADTSDGNLAGNAKALNFFDTKVQGISLTNCAFAGQTVEGNIIIGRDYVCDQGGLFCDSSGCSVLNEVW